MEEIEEIATDFRKKIITDSEDKGFCFMVSYPLCIYLRLHGFKNDVEGENGHYWLKTDSDLIIDPTIKQFDIQDNTSYDLIYFGKGEKMHETNSVNSENWNVKIEHWKYPLLNEGITKFSNEIDLKYFLGVNLRAATLILVEVKKSKSNKFIDECEENKKKIDEYFRNINEILIAEQNVKIIAELEAQNIIGDLSGIRDYCEKQK